MITIPVVNVKLDRLSLIHNIDNYEDFVAVVYFVLGARDYKNKKGYSFKAEKYYKRCTYPLSGNETLSVQVGISKGKQYVKITFNPGKLDAVGWYMLYSHLSIMFDYGYHTFYELCRIDRIEIAVDVTNIDLMDVHAVDYRLQSYSTEYLNKGLYYLGNQHSKRNFAIYDKKNQLLNCKGITIPEAQLLRIEARLNPQNLLLTDIETLTNPFQYLRIFQLGKNEVKETPLWTAFTDDVATKPLAQAAYLQRTSYERLALQARINQVCVSWWKPQQHWVDAVNLFPILKPPAQIY